MKQLLKIIFILFVTLTFTSCFVARKIPEIEKNLEDIQKKAELKNGYQTIAYIDGSIYEGNLYDGLYHGQGKLTLEDGTIFEGTYNAGTITYGTADYGNGNRYTGSFTNNKWNGKGFLHKGNGDFYLGQFSNGNITGSGEYYNSTSQTTISGKFTDGIATREVITKKNGHEPTFSYFSENGSDITNQYINNKANDIVDKKNKAITSPLVNNLSHLSSKLQTLYPKEKEYLRVAENPCAEAKRVARALNKDGTNCSRQYNSTHSKGNITVDDNCRVIINITPFGYIRLRVGKYTDSDKARDEYQREQCKKAVDNYNNNIFNSAQLYRKVAQEISFNESVQNKLKNELEAEKRKQIINKQKDLANAKKEVKQEIKKKVNSFNDNQRKAEAACLANPRICGCSKFVKKDPCNEKGVSCGCAI